MSSTPPATPARRPNTVRVVIVVGAAVLALALVALVIWFLVPRDDTPGPWRSVSPSPSASASATASASSAASAPPDASGEPAESAAPSAPAIPSSTIASFTVTPEVAACADERASTVPLSFAWESSGGERAWIGVGTNDASVQPFADVPLSATGYGDVVFECRDAEQLFTLTVQGPDGSVSASVSVVREVG